MTLPRFNPLIHAVVNDVPNGDLTVYERLVHVWMSQPIWWDAMETKPLSYEAVGDALGIHYKTAGRALRGLVEKGYWTQRRQMHGPNFYTFVVDDETYEQYDWSKDKKTKTTRTQTTYAKVTPIKKATSSYDWEAEAALYNEEVI